MASFNEKLEEILIDEDVETDEIMEHLRSISEPKTTDGFRKAREQTVASIIDLVEKMLPEENLPQNTPSRFTGEWVQGYNQAIRDIRQKLRG